MALNYTIKVIRENNTETYSGKASSVDDISKVLKDINETLSKGDKAVIELTYMEVGREQFEYEARINRKHGEVRWVK